MTNHKPEAINYRDAGVDIDAGNALVERIKPLAKATTRAGVIGGLGGFGGLFDLKATGMVDPVLVAATDGVGTKLLLAQHYDDFAGIGVDLVAMCVNDLIVQGAEPLFFLDYFACGALDVEQAARVVASIAEGCTQAGCALIGGETAEMPGLYGTGEFDLAGFSVGAAERGALLPRQDAMQAGDVLLGLPSSGVHSNGYALVRRLLSTHAVPLDGPAPFDAGQSLQSALMAPTRIYVKPLLHALKAGGITGMAHVTGGGISENVPRMLPEGLAAQIDRTSWALPPLFTWLQGLGSLSDADMLRTFNCGIGMVVAVQAEAADAVQQALHDAGETPLVMGRLSAGDAAVVQYVGA